MQGRETVAFVLARVANNYFRDKMDALSRRQPDIARMIGKDVDAVIALRHTVESNGDAAAELAALDTVISQDILDETTREEIFAVKAHLKISH